MTDKEVVSSHRRFAVPIILGEYEEQNVVVWRLPQHISQSRLGGRQHSSSACTIISLKLVENIYRNTIVFPAITETNRLSRYFFTCITKLIGSEKESKLTCPGRLINCMANSILEGNEIHENLLAKLSQARKNFTIPEAIRAMNGIIHELDYCSLRGTLTDDFPGLLLSAIYSKRLSSVNQLYFLLIALRKCVVIVYNRKTETLGFLDSHNHPPNGAIIASTPLGNLNHFAHWMKSEVFEELNFIPLALQFFELSCLCISDELKRSKHCSSIDCFQNISQQTTDERIFSPEASHQKITSNFVAEAQ